MTTRAFPAVAAALAAMALTTIAPAAPPPTMPFSDVASGMKGTGKTVFSGTTVSDFDVEILGKLPNVGPDQNIILARCSGGPLAQTGIMAGMSGSPVYVGGKLIGAVAYGWGFATDAFAGITPIDEILAVGSRDKSAPSRTRRSFSWPAGALAALTAPERLAAFLENELPARAPLFADGGAAGERAVPLTVAGLGPRGLSRLAPSLRRAGFLPVQSGGSGASEGSPATLEPGSAVGVKLVRGDIDMTATGTVTWVDGNDVYAFGHPLFGLGAVDLPLNAARVEALLPSLERSAKIAIPLRELGAFRQDRGAGIFGRLGQAPRMVPVRVQLNDGSGNRRSYAFDIASDPLLTPYLLYGTLNGLLDAAERTFGSATVTLRQGSVIKLDGQDDVTLDNMFSGDAAAAYATGLPAYVLYLLMNNDWQTPQVSGVNLIIDYEAAPRTAAIRRVTLDRYRVRRGESVTATVVVAPYRGEEIVYTRSIEIPPETPPGGLLVQVGDAGSVSRAESADEPVYPRDLTQLIRLINRLRRNDRVHIVASRADTGVLLGGSRLPNLPPAAAAIVSRPRSSGNYALLAMRGVLEEEIPTEHVIEGFARVQLEVDEP